jgi:chromosome transmission fidelity protein 4
MTDYFGFTMAAISEGGCVFASPRKGEKNPSMILYRPFSSWASNSEVRIKQTQIVCLKLKWANRKRNNSIT